MSDTAQLIVDGNTYELPLVKGTENELAIDISKLRASSGLITLDPGYKNTGATKSAITFLNGEKGILRYRGYPIEQLAEKSDFLEVAYLLIHGELPNHAQLEYFTDSITHHSLIHEDMKRFYEAFPSNAHPMGILSSMISSLSTFHPESLDPNRPFKDIELTIHRLIGKISTLAALSYKSSYGQPYIYPDDSLSYVENFLYMMFALPTKDYETSGNC